MTSTVSPSVLDTDYEVLIVGGGPAGLAAALTCGRLGRKVLLCDDGQPRNQPSEHINNFPGHDGIDPEVWRQTVKTELQKYPTVQLHTGRVAEVTQDGAGFVAHMQSGHAIPIQKVLLAYGIKDQLPAIENVEKLWGKTVVHCPYCHGFEFRNQPLAVLGDGDMLLHILALLLGLSSDIVVFSNGPSQLTPEQRGKIAAQGIQLIETPVRKLRHSGTQLEAVELANGEQIPRHALYVMPQFPFARSAQIGEALGCQVTEFGWYEVDAFCQTSVPGVYAAGDIAGMRGQSVLNSAASGSMAASRIVADILTAKAGF
ncbi:MAG: NAD(P)/FAD-dependent oxidoreductase [Candidatus Sericytochromatia bacterium]